MSEERMEILKMIADKVITVEDGERLLAAVDENRPGKKDYKKTRKGGVVSGIEDLIGGIGPMVKNIVGETLEATIHIGGDHIEDAEPVEVQEGRFDLPDDSELIIRPFRKVKSTIGSGSDIQLTGTDGAQCEIRNPDDADIKVSRKGKKTYILWECGSIEVAVPANIRELSAVTYGGDIGSCSVDVKSLLKTMGGNLAIIDPGKEFEAKTMGGSVTVELNRPLEFDSVAKTMGGDVSCRISAEQKGTIKAKTMGGDITVAPDIGVVREEGRIASKKIKILLKAGEGPQLDLKTMGGNIRINAITTDASEETI